MTMNAINRASVELDPNYEKTLRTIEIFEQAVEVFGSENAAQDWMTSPAYGLENQTSVDLLDTDIGAAQIKGLLSAIKYGNVW